MFVLTLLCSAAHAGSLSARYTFAIGPQSLSSALLAFSELTDIQVSTASADLKDLKSAGVMGEWTASDALQTLFAGTDLTFRAVAQNAVAIEPRKGRETDRTKVSATGSGMRIAGADAGQAGGSATQGSQHDAPENVTQSGGGKLEEIIVTATKRAERVEDVPMSIAVIGNQDIERRGLIGMEDYLRSIPGVNQVDRGGADNAIVIRGITTSPQNENAGSGATVGTYFGETPITGAAGVNAGGIDVRPVDIDRIEVLRGPQGTAYGAASLGGTLRIIPAEPKLDAFSGKVAASLSDTGGNGSENSMMQGVINIPVVAGKFALRAVGYRYDDSGFYRNVAGNDPLTVAAAGPLGIANDVTGYTQDDVGRMRSTGGRLAALWRVTDKLDLHMNLLTQRIEQDGRPYANSPYANAGLGEYDQIRYPITPLGRERGEKGEVADTDLDLLNLALNYDFGWAALNAAASRVDSGSFWNQDSTYLLVDAGTSANRSDFDSFTTEVRLTSALSGRTQFLVGVYYEDVSDDLLQRVSAAGAPAPNRYGTNPISEFSRGLNRKQHAGFGEVSYALTDKWTATAGIRYFRYDKNDTLLREGGLYRVPYGTGITSYLKSSDEGDNFKASLSYKPTRDSLVYASWREGFRLGVPQAGVAPTCDANNDGLIDGTNITVESTRRLDPDFLDNYEIGAKAAFFDRRLMIDSAVYHIDWEGLPVGTRGGSCLTTFSANIGAATSDGVELQANLFVTERLKIEFGGGYVNARLAKDAPTLNARKGARLPGSPKVSANLAVQYEFDLAGFDAFLRADSFYSGEFYGDLQESLATRAGDYIKLDTRAGVNIRHLSIELFARNLTNEDAFTWRSVSAIPPIDYRLRPRTVGVQLGYSFQ